MFDIYIIQTIILESRIYILNLLILILLGLEAVIIMIAMTIDEE